MDITDDLINKIHGEVGRYLAGSSSRPAVKFKPGNPDHFEKAVEHLAKVLALLLKALGSSRSLFFRLVAAMCLLGPRDEPPPRTMCLQLLNILGQHVPDEEQQKVRLMEFVIAFGCGKWRQVDRTSQGWNRVWSGAILALARAMISPVTQCREWLGEMLDLGLVPDEQDEDKKHKEESKKRIRSDAAVLAMRLSRPEQCYELEPGESMVITYAKEETTAEYETKEETAAEYRTTVKILPDPKIHPDTRYESREIRPSAKYVVEIRRGREFTLELPGERVVFPGGTRFIISVHDDRTVLDCISYEDLLETGSPATVAETEDRLREKGIPIPKGSKPIPKREGAKVRTQIRRKATLRKGETAAVSCGPGRAIAAVWECTCGNVHCRERHRLEGWDPRFSLWAFAAGAVKGPIPRRTGKRGQSPEEEAGRRPIQIGTFVQGMYFPLLNEDKEALECGGYGKRLENVRLRLVRLCHTVCSCGNTYMGPRCGRCDPEFARPTRRPVKERLITVPPRLPLARLPFLKCNECKSVTECSQDDLEKETKCQSCGKPVIQEARLKEILEGLHDEEEFDLDKLKKLQKERKTLIKRDPTCPHCGTMVEELPWTCSFCGSSSMSQKVTHAWTFDPRSWRVEDSSRGHRVDEGEVGSDEETQSDGELNFNDE